MESTASLTYCPHPIIPAQGVIYESETPKDGETITEYLKRVKFSPQYNPFLLSVDGKLIDIKYWRFYKLNKDSLIIIRSMVQGGGDGGSNPLAALVSIGLLFIPGAQGAGLAGLSAGQAVGAIATKFAVSLLSGIVINAISPNRPDTSGRSGVSASPNYSLSGATNAIRKFEPMSVSYGENRVFPDTASIEYAEFEGNEQFLSQGFHFGLGKIEKDALSIGDTRITEFEGVEIEESDESGALTSISGNVDSIAGQEIKNADGWVQRVTSLNTIRIGIDITGIIFENHRRKGLRALSVTFERRYRKVGTTEYTNLESVTITNDTPTPVRRSYYWNVPIGQYEFEIRKLGSDYEGRDDFKSDISLQIIRSYQQDAVDYSGQNRLAVRIQASGQLNGRLDRINAIVKRHVLVWKPDSETWVEEYSSNPAYCYLSFLRGIFINNFLVHGCGFADDEIDIENIKQWGAWCDLNGLGCNLIIDTKESRADTLNKLARTGRASPTWQTGKIGIVYDLENQPFSGVLNMSNIIEGSFSIEYSTGETADEIIGRYVNPELGWEQDTVRAVIPGVVNPTKTATIDLPGITDKVIAQQEVNLQAAAQTIFSRRYTMTVDARGLLIKRGSVMLLSHDLGAWGFSGRLLSGTETVLKLSRPVFFNNTERHYVAITTPENETFIREVEYSAVETDVLNLIEPLPFIANDDELCSPEDYIFLFEPKETPGKKIKIIDYTPKEGGQQFSLEAVDEYPEYYEAKNNINAITGISTSSNIARIDAVNVSEELVEASNGFVTRINVDLTVSGRYRDAVVYAAFKDEEFEQVARISGSIRASFIVRKTGLIRIRVVPGNRLIENGVPFETLYYVLGKVLPPAPVESFAVETDLDGTRIFTFSQNTEIDLAGYIIRWSLGVVTETSQMTLLHNGYLTSSPYETNQLSAGSYSFAITAIDTSGNESDPTFIIGELGEPRIRDAAYYENVSRNGWKGTKTDSYVDGKNVLTAGGSTTWNDLQTDNTEWGDQSNNWIMNPLPSISYEHTLIDIGAVIQFLPIITPQILGGVGTVQISYSVDDVTYTPWIEPVGQVIARYFKVRLNVTANTDELIQVTNFTIVLSTSIIEETINDENTSSWGGSLNAGRIIPIDNDYSVITQVIVTIQNVSSARTYTVIDKNTNAPRIKIFDGSTSVDELVDVTIKGIAKA